MQQYIAASGGEWALNKVTSMYAMGKVRMTAAELNSSDGDGGGTGHGHRGGKKGGKGCGGEVGGFVLWQKKPELWCLELVVSGCKISAGSDGKVAWRQTPWHQSHASRGPPRPLRRSLQVRSVPCSPPPAFPARDFVYVFPQLAPRCRRRVFMGTFHTYACCQATPRTRRMHKIASRASSKHAHPSVHLQPPPDELAPKSRPDSDVVAVALPVLSSPVLDDGTNGHDATARA